MNEQEKIEEPWNWEREPKTDKEIRQLVIDVLAGTVFHPGLVKEMKDYMSCFMPYMLSTPAQKKQMFDSGVCLIYQHFNKDNLGTSMVGNEPRPMFHSFEYLFEEETERYLKYQKELFEWLEGKNNA